MMLNEDSIRNALKAVKYPGYSGAIVSCGLVKYVAANNGPVSIMLQLTSPNPEVAQQLKHECERVLKSMPEVRMVHVEVKMPAGSPATAQSPWASQNKVPGLHRIIAVASGKGGVGKST